MAVSPTFSIYISKWTSSPALSVCNFSPVTVSVVVARGDRMSVADASGPVRPSASTIFLSSSSAQSNATSEVLAIMITAKINGVSLLIIISSKRVGWVSHALFGIYDLATISA